MDGTDADLPGGSHRVSAETAATAPISRGEVAGFALLALLLGLIYAWPVLASGSNWGIRDWDQHLFYHAVPRRAILSYHQLPLWNPYYCGGTAMLANPQTRALSPALLVHLVLGTVRGIKVDIWLHYAVGLLGVYVAGRSLAMCRLGACLASFIFMFSSAYALHLTVGHTWILPAALIPWVLLSLAKSYRDRRYAIATGALLALIFLDGGHYVLPITALFVTAGALLYAVPGNVRRSAAVLVLVSLFALGFSAIKLLPSVEFLRTYPRQGEAGSGASLMSLYHMTLNPDQRLETIDRYSPQADFFSGMANGLSENGMYLGWLGLALALVGLVTTAKRHWRPTLCLVLALWLYFGIHAPISLWRVVHRLPVFSQMGPVTRFRFLVLICLAFFAGVGLTRLQGWLHRVCRRRIVPQAILMVIVVGVFVDLASTARPILASAFAIPALAGSEKGASPAPAQPGFRQIDRLPCYDPGGFTANTSWYEHVGAHAVPTQTTFSAMYPAFLRNQGTVRAYEPVPVVPYARPFDHRDYRGEVYLWPPVGQAEFVYWSPNRLIIEVRAERDTRLMVNQNFAPGWHVSGDRTRKVLPSEGLLSLPITPWDRRVELYYRPASFVIGAAFTGMTSLIAAAWLAWTPIRRLRASRPQG